jgi:hypothetical protein
MMFAAIVVGGIVAGGSVAFATPSYNGIFVVVDPYDSSDMQFLACAASTQPKPSCNGVAASNSGFANPFSGQAASGIFLRVPWCAFQVAATSGQNSLGTPGECHYQLQGASGLGSYVAGSFTSSGALQFSGQSSVDLAISNLSTCAKVVYDTCSNSVLGTALRYINQINAKSATPLGLSVALIAGQYTPRSVLDAAKGGHVGYVDLPKVDSHHNLSYCIREPLAWQPKYVQYYTAAEQQLANYIRGPGFAAPPIVIFKQGAMTSNSAEFDVPATTTTSGFQTAVDPALPPDLGGTGNGVGPQGGAAMQCPDHTPYLSGVGALLNQYQIDGVAGETMANAYESAFGFIMGYEWGVLSASGNANSVLSIATKGSQNFAEVACGTDGSSMCIPDPNPARGRQFAWSEYYFTKFINDIFISGSVAYTNASNGFSDACRGKSCSHASYDPTPWALAVVYTGLDPTVVGASYTGQPSCWLNNTNATGTAYTTPATLLLYTAPLPNLSSTTVVVIGVPAIAPAPAGGTMLGWQTITSSGGACDTVTYSLQDAIRNGGQFVEIETDAAAEPACETPLRQTLSHMVAPNTNYSCEYF